MKRFFLYLTAVLVLGAALACRDKTENTPGSPDQAATASPSSEGAAPGVTPGASRGELKHDGATRTYRLFVPEGIAGGERVPLVVGLHGGLGTGEQFADNSQFEKAAREHGFIAVFPDGVGRTWNGGNCCGQAARNDVDDVGFLAALIEALSARLPIDRERVFMTGHSNGGIMAFRFGCERADLVAAIAPVAGSLEVPKCEPSRGVDLLAIHGDADQSHPLNGGQGPRSIAGVDFVSQARSLELWTAGMKCPDAPTPRPEGATTTTTWSGCRDGAGARLMIVHGADHPWPGGVNPPPIVRAETSKAIDATAVITQFFLER